MSNGTLDYDSVGGWVKVAVWATKEYEKWKYGRVRTEINGILYGIDTEEGKLAFFHACAVYALSIGFTLRLPNRYNGFRRVLNALEGDQSDELSKVYYRHDREKWLTERVNGKKKKNGLP